VAGLGLNGGELFGETWMGEVTVTPEVWNCLVRSRDRRNYKRRWMRARRRFIAELKLACGCCFCRYRRCAAALEFHHVDGRDRSEQFSNMGLDRLRDEVSKCLVMCANCHRELHDSERKRK
jgi:hypothetical protein